MNIENLLRNAPRIARLEAHYHQESQWISLNLILVDQHGIYQLYQHHVYPIEMLQSASRYAQDWINGAPVK